MQKSLEKCLTELTCDGEDNSAEAIFTLPSDFPAFNGHFPGKPVFPAFVQLLAVRLVAARICGCRLRPESTGKIKFTGMVGPEQDIWVRVGLTRRDSDWQASFTIKSGVEKIASGTIIYGEAD